PSVLVNGYNGGSGKMDVSLDIIRENIGENRKVLLFSQFTSVLKNIGKMLTKNGIEYYYLDGSTKPEERIELVNKFNNGEDKKVFLISLKAGGTGLNLTSANVVVHFDPWWNPAVEDQATDRAHRFGQKNVVQVIKLIAEGSVEDKIITLQEDKKELINKVITGDFKEGGFLKGLSKEDLEELFS
ncbi:DEAD/DEAH box helicase, partial [Clostridium cadaveris]